MKRPFFIAAGCQAIDLYADDEEEKDCPKAVVGLMDLSAHLDLRNYFGDNVMSMSLPWSMFQTMEGDVAGSFLERNTWNKLMQSRTA